jgi:hypothetical protein
MMWHSSSLLALCSRWRGLQAFSMELEGAVVVERQGWSGMLQCVDGKVVGQGAP